MNCGKETHVTPRPPFFWTGELPPSIQRATPSPLTTTNNNRNDTNNNNNHTGPIDGGAAGVRVKHSCPSCTTYDAQAVTRSILIFDQVPSHPNWAAEGFTHSHIFPDEKRRLIIKVKPYFGSSSISGCRVADLPLVTLNSIKLNGRRLNSYQFELFRRLANGVGSARFVVR